jgi:hypothetical protein
MKVLKIVGIVLLILIAFPLILALFIPKTYTISVSETVNRPRQEVFDYLRILGNQKEYSVWVMADPNLEPEIVGNDGTVGAIQKWNSPKDEVGEGEQEITSVSLDSITVDLRFKRPWEGKAKAANVLSSVSENQTQITAKFYSDSKYPFNLMSYFFGKKMIEDAEAKNLKNIKGILER